MPPPALPPFSSGNRATDSLSRIAHSSPSLSRDETCRRAAHFMKCAVPHVSHSWFSQSPVGSTDRGPHLFRDLISHSSSAANLAIASQAFSIAAWMRCGFSSMPLIEWRAILTCVTPQAQNDDPIRPIFCCISPIDKLQNLD